MERNPFDDVLEEEEEEVPMVASSAARIGLPKMKEDDYSIFDDLLEESDLEDAQQVKDCRASYSVEELLVANYLKRTGDMECGLVGERPTLASLMKFAVVLTSLGKVVTDAPIDLNKLKNVNMKKAATAKMRCTQDVLKWALLGSKANAVSYVTPYIVGQIAIHMLGAECDRNDKEHGVNGWDVTVPEFPTVFVEGDGGYPSGAIKGAEEFVKHFNNVYKTNYEYLHLTPDECRMAYYLTGVTSFKWVGDTLTTSHRIPQGDKFNYNVFGEAMKGNHEKAYMGFSYLLGEYHKAGHRINKQINIRSNVQGSMEIILSMIKSKMAAGWERASLAIPKLAARDVTAASLAIERFMAEVGNVAKNPYCLLKDGGLSKKGDLGQFRKANEEYRAGLKTDVRKLDSLGGSGFGASATSVPYKIKGCLDEIANFVTPPNDVLAFGVGDANYWCPTISAAFTGTKVWYDIDKDGTAKHGVPVIKRDILSLAEGEGRGKFLADDTTAADPLMKLPVVARADFECGFIKLMYGWGSDALNMLYQVPREVLEFRRKYGFVNLLKFSPHSEEYFLVFARVAVGHTKFPTPFKKAGDEATPEEWANRMRTWYAYVASQIYAANVFKTASALAGAPIPMHANLKTLNSKITPIKIDHIVAGGAEVFRVRGDPKALGKGAAGRVELEEDALEEEVAGLEEE